MDKRSELAGLENQFGSYSNYRIREDRVYGEIFHADFVEEDSAYDYEGKFDDLDPGLRLTHLGKLEDYLRYKTLKEELES